MTLSKVDVFLLAGMVFMALLAADEMLSASPTECDHQCSEITDAGRTGNGGFNFCIRFKDQDCKPCVYGGGCKTSVSANQNCDNDATYGARKYWVCEFCYLTCDSDPNYTQANTVTGCPDPLTTNPTTDNIPRKICQIGSGG